MGTFIAKGKETIEVITFDPGTVSVIHFNNKET